MNVGFLTYFIMVLIVAPALLIFIYELMSVSTQKYETGKHIEQINTWHVSIPMKYYSLAHNNMWTYKHASTPARKAHDLRASY